MQAVAAAGYRAIAPDCRGYGLSDQPPEHEEPFWEDLVADVLAILDALSIPKVFLVGKDFGAMPAYDFALRHPGRTRGVACLGIAFSPNCSNLKGLPEPEIRQRWRQPGQAEADFGRYNIRCVVRTIYVLFSGREIPAAEQGQEAMDLADGSAPLPEWFTEEDLDVYAALYENSGFGYPIKMPYGSLDKMATQLEARFEVPVLMVMGEDYVMKLPGFEAAVRGGMMAGFAPDLKVAFVPEGRHFVQEQFPTQVNELLLGFLKDHP
ncbi:bifunctional epoxide hydrolase 2-like [Triticum aestivum]|uniref:bifunctional epoxide hydrolase 2-like n=1 Tax=Triticum aestivum TaxID=4565 RepID=UPI001D028C61|nr:bifunctional epoxide hydrolase 2-like [Triticum aestivum]